MSLYSYVLRVSSPTRLTMIEEISGVKSSLSGNVVRRCINVIRIIVSRVCDERGVPRELHRHFQGRITFRGDMELDDEAGAKLMLLFVLSKGLRDVVRIELMAWRILWMTAEEAQYLLGWVIHRQKPESDWAAKGLRILLAGEVTTQETLDYLEKLRWKRYRLLHG